MGPKKPAKKRQQTSSTIQSLELSAAAALELKNELEADSAGNGLGRIPLATLARALGVRGECHASAVDVGSSDGGAAGDESGPKDEEERTVIVLDGAGDEGEAASGGGVAVVAADGTNADDGGATANEKKPKQEPACKGLALDPACLCGLIPENDTRYRKTGLWSKAAKKMAEDEEPPSKRKGKQTRAGLENLGNTCYINSVLQVRLCVQDSLGWFHWPDSSVLNAAPHSPHSPHPPDSCDDSLTSL